MEGTQTSNTNQYQCICSVYGNKINPHDEILAEKNAATISTSVASLRNEDDFLRKVKEKYMNQ